MSLYDNLLERLEGKQYSNYFTCCCIFHSESNPSLFIYEESDNKNYEFRCASCGKHGSLVYLDKYLGSHHRQELTQSQVRKPSVLPRWSRWERDYGDLDGIAKFAHKNVYNHMEFFKRRKIDEFIEKGYFGWIDGWNLLPVFERGTKRIVDIVVRAGKHKPGTRYVVAPISSSVGHGLYSPDWERVENSKTIFIPFGLLDSWTFESLGLASVTGLSGKFLSPELIKSLGKRYVLVPDLGEEKEAYELSNKLGWRCSVEVLKYPDNVKDPDEVRRVYGCSYLKEMLVHYV